MTSLKKMMMLMSSVVMVGSMYAGYESYLVYQDEQFIQNHKLTTVHGCPNIPSDLVGGLASITMLQGDLLAGSGSGFLVAPGVVMTAGHCISDDVKNTRIVINNVEYIPVAVRAHKDFIMDGLIPNGDNADVGFYYLTQAAVDSHLVLPVAPVIDKGVHLRGAGFGAGDYAQFLEGEVLLTDMSSLMSGDTHTTLSVYSEGGFSGSVFFNDKNEIAGILVRGFPAAPKYDSMDEYNKVLRKRGYIPGSAAIYGQTMRKYATHLTNVKHIQELVDQHNKDVGTTIPSVN